jgi:hypothetical protein
MLLKNPTSPTRNIFSQMLFSVITRLGLGVWLLFTDPMAVTFRYLLVIIFCIPLLRYAIHKITGVTMDNALSRTSSKKNTINVIIYILVFTVYIFAVPHILSVYTSVFLGYLLVITLPVIVAYMVIKDIIRQEHTASNEHALILTMAFYILPFLAGINYAFDFSTPKVETYYVTGREEYTTAGNSLPDEGPSIIYYLFLLPVDTMKTPPRWMELSEAEGRKIITFNGSGSMIIDSIRYAVVEVERRLNSVKNPPPGDSNRVTASYYVKAFRTNEKVIITKCKYRIYQRFVPGDYLYRENYRGLLGIPWQRYR